METHKYTCKYCYIEYIPKRRHVQKFCSATCRSKAHHIKNKGKQQIDTTESNEITSNQVDKMSLAGVGNAAAGTFVSDSIKSIFTATDNKPATKGDLKRLSERLDRYHLVKNLQSRSDGALPHYDMDTKEIVYMFLQGPQRP